MTVKFNEYNEDKNSFFKKHNYNFKCDTSSMDEYGRYHKEYVFEDGAVWYEVMSPTWQNVEVEVKLVKVVVKVKLLSTEFWSSDNASSKYYYEKF